LVSESESADRRASKENSPSGKSFLRKLGPGLITGVSDDDPSGIATYSQAGAQFGYSMLWTAVFSYPLMTAMQEISARIGRVTGRGIAANMRRYSPPFLLYSVVLLLFVASVFNLGADLGAMGAATQLLIGGSTTPYVVLFGFISLLLQIYIPYTSYTKYLKWLTLAVLSYIVTAFAVHVPWPEALRATFFPSLSLNAKYCATLTAVLGTTISPYLFFWQASLEVEEVRVNQAEQPLKQSPHQAAEQFERIRADTWFGMAVSNVVAFFIILTAASTLHRNGVLDVQTSAQAAKALEPIAGRFAFFLFAAGIVGTGLLAVPVLAGAAAYSVAETFKWRGSLQRKPHKAKRFYGVLTAATLIGLSLNLVKIDPIRALFWSAMINGVVAVPVMIVVMLLSANRKVMGEFSIPILLKIIGWVATAAMFLATVAMFVTLRH
jgi:NRAMP (natural resistance-associated macrophage protein)-like metal ion transporter